jgi:hypothetical protein
LVVVAMALPVAACAADWWKQSESVAYGAPPLYCYRSLADVDCYAAPFDRDRRRLIGYTGPWPGYGPPPPAPLVEKGCASRESADPAGGAAMSCPGSGAI